MTDQELAEIERFWSSSPAWTLERVPKLLVEVKALLAEVKALNLQKRELIEALRELVARYRGITIAYIEEQELGYAMRAYEAIAKAEGKPIDKPKPEPFDPPQGTIGDPPRNPNWSVDVGE